MHKMINYAPSQDGQHLPTDNNNTIFSALLLKSAHSKAISGVTQLTSKVMYTCQLSAFDAVISTMCKNRFKKMFQQQGESGEFFLHNMPKV